MKTPAQNISSEIITSGDNKPAQKISKNVILIASIALVVIIAAIVILILHQRHKKKAVVYTSSSVCTAASNAANFSQAVLYLGSDYTNELAPYVKHIQAISGYQRDPNCLYVLATYYSNLGDTTQAQKDITAYYQYYNQKQGLSNYLMNEPSMQTIQAKVTQQLKIEQYDQKQSQQEKYIPPTS